MFQHQCGANVYLDLGDVVRVLVSFGISNTALRIGGGDLVITKAETSSMFYCPTCQKNVPLSELYACCHHCGKVFPVTEMYKPKLSGGVYDHQHGEEFFSDEGLVPLTSIVTKVQIK